MADRDARRKAIEKASRQVHNGVVSRCADSQPERFTHVCLDCGALGVAGGYHDHGDGEAGDTIPLAELPALIRSLGP